MEAGATRRKSSGEIPGCRDIWMLEAAMKEIRTFREKGVE
jgi:hypothetical protein